MIHGADHFFFKDVFEVFQIEDHAGDGIRLAFDRDLHDVVVAMAVAVGAFAVERAIFIVAELGKTADVRSGKVCAARDKHGH